MGSPVFRGCHLVPSLLLLLYTRVNGDTPLGCYFSFVFILCRLQFKFCIHETTSLWWKENRLIRFPLQKAIALSTCLAISLQYNFLGTSAEITMCRSVFVGCLCSAHNVEPSCTSRNSNIRQMLQETFISGYFFTPCEGIQGSLGFWILRHGFRISFFVSPGLWIPPAKCSRIPLHGWSYYPRERFMQLSR